MGGWTRILIVVEIVVAIWLWGPTADNWSGMRIAMADLQHAQAKYDEHIQKQQMSRDTPGEEKQSETSWTAELIPFDPDGDYLKEDLEKAKLVGQMATQGFKIRLGVDAFWLAMPPLLWFVVGWGVAGFRKSNSSP
jgi:hypothetical protein